MTQMSFQTGGRPPDEPSVDSDSMDEAQRERVMQELSARLAREARQQGAGRTASKSMDILTERVCKKLGKYFLTKTFVKTIRKAVDLPITAKVDEYALRVGIIKYLTAEGNDC